MYYKMHGSMLSTVILSMKIQNDGQRRGTYSFIVQSGHMKGLVTTSSCSDPATISSCFLLLYVPFLANFISHTIRKRWQHACYCFLELCIFKQHISFCSCHSSTIYLMWITQLPITAASFILLPVNSDFSHSLKVVTVLH